MKEFILKILLFIGVFGFIIYFTVRLTPPFKDNYLYAQVYKNERLDTLATPRLVLIGGSNIAFGLDSKRIEDSLKINVQNMGLHGGIGLRFMIDDALPSLLKGDTVIIMQELSHLSSAYNGDPNELATVFYNSTTADWKVLNFDQFLNVLRGTPKYISYNWKHYRETLKDKNDDVTDSLEWKYSSANFNKWGDEEAHRNTLIENKEIKSSKMKSTINKSYVKDFTNKIRVMQNKGCIVYLFWPIIGETAFSLSQELIRNLEKALSEQGIFFSNSPTDFVLPDSLRLDTDYHSNGKGVELSTARFIEKMKSLRRK